MKKYILISVLIVIVGGVWFLGWGKKREVAAPTKVMPPTTEEQNQKTESLLVGLYREELKAASGPGRIVSLQLNADKSATYIDDYQNGKPVITESGTWALGEENRITVTLKENETLVFKYDTTAGTLELKDYDKSVWGKDGLEMTKTLDLTGTTWTWLETTLADETEISPDSKQSFSITFGEKGKLELTTDCNKVDASYKTNGIDEMSFKLGAMTLMACEGSHEGDFLKELGSVESFLLEGSSLRLTLKDETGTMTFTRK